MTHLSGHDRSQLLLLPEAVDDYVGADNPVRFIDGEALAGVYWPASVLDGDGRGFDNVAAQRAR